MLSTVTKAIPLEDRRTSGTIAQTLAFFAMEGNRELKQKMSSA